ncbi:MAG: murein biosynthesis integral membrane protein MurJ [Actinomycetota bacterium]|nr:murein biosynthesis integral membrane protein MurJ [Actinomycetota bacterium]
MSHRPAEIADADTRLLSASMFMALGTVLSRLTGFLRAALLLAAIGKSLDADIFTQANTIPNSLYILVAGGIFNVVLVPQLVRSMRNDADGGQAYASRVLTLGLIVLGVATVALVVCVPLVARLAFDGDFFDADLSAQRESAYALMRYCMPQVFFYGAFVLVGQMLNARERFGPMMWAPILNNVIACSVLVAYIALYGRSDTADGFSVEQELLLGAGSSVGVLAQALILIPYVRAAGITLRPRFDFRGVGLGHTLRLGLWTFGFVILNQVAFFVISRIAVGSSITAAQEGGEASGATVYQSAFLIIQVPHAIITVSLVTATMPLLSRLAAGGDLAGVRGEIVRTLRLVLTAVVPFGVLLACLGQPIAALLFGYGDADTTVIGETITAFAPGLVLFTLHYLLLRGFYATEDTRTPFLMQIALASTNIGAAIGLTTGAPPEHVAALLAVAYALAYLVGVVCSGTLLSRRVGRILDRSMLLFLLQLLLAAGCAAGCMLGLVWVLGEHGVRAASVGQALTTTAVAGVGGALTYVVVARLTHLPEMRSLLAAVTRHAR